MKKTKILFITGSRGEWGYIRPILRIVEKHNDLDYSLCVTNMHLLPSFGMSAQEIEGDGFRVDHKIFMAYDGYNHISMVKSLASFLSSVADILSSDKPDWIVLAGDRGEQLMGAIVGGFCYIPVAHIQAGELSGNIDGMTRHAIGKYAHIHFASNEDAASRLIKLGEEPFRVHNVGAPQLDELVQGFYTSKKDLEKNYDIDISKKYIMVVQHPVTEEFDEAYHQIEVTMKCLSRFEMPKIVIMPNNDAGSSLIKKGINQYRHGEFFLFANLKRQDYLGFMNNAACIIGNSSSGLLEAPTFKLPAINLGRRQNMRMQGPNVINAPFEEVAVIDALNKALSMEFKSSLSEQCFNPYGDGTSSKKIVEILLKTRVTDKLLIKNLTY